MASKSANPGEFIIINDTQVAKAVFSQMNNRQQT